MPENTDNKPILNECKTIAENCLYTAQTHFIMADKAGRRSFWLLLIPACVASLMGILTAVGCPGWLGAFSALAGVTIAVATYCDIGQKEVAHKTAANLLTSLRHEARAINETYWAELSHEQLVAEVHRLGDRYSTLCQALKTTDVASYEEARTRIKSGIFVPDFRGEKRASLEKTYSKEESNGDQ